MTTLATTERQAPTRPLRAWDYLTLNVYWFALSFLWNSMGPILLPTLVPMLVPEAQKGSALGTLSALGLIVAIAVQPAAGAWTDARTTRWGKRRPYIVGGTLFDVVFLLAMAFAGNYIVLLVGYLLLQFSSNIAHGPYQGYIPELVPEQKRGAASGVARFLEIVGIIVTSLATGALVGQGQIFLAFLAIIFFLLFCMAITAVFVTEQPFEGASPVGASHATAVRSHGSPLQTIFYSRDFFLWLVSRLLILLGGNLVRNYVLFFLKDVLGLPNPAAEVGNLLAIIAVAIALVVYPAGALSDRWGRKWPIVLSGVLGAVGALLLMSATTVTMVLIVGGIIGVGIGIFLSVNWAWATDLVPADESGRFLGISNLATAGSGVLAGIGGYVLDYFNAQSPNLGYTALFLIAAVCYLLGTAVVFGVKDTKRIEKQRGLPA
ncbi:MAG: MFS transporter [Chloroflexi bacterium]|nr:MFS transporter [Chloroflexota bacterium]